MRIFDMRRIALLGLTLLLPACQDYVGNPIAGAGGFLGDTMNIHLNPNAPVGNAPNLLRAAGRQVEQPPLTPEPGDVWPGPVAPEPTLQDIQRQQNQQELGNPEQPPPSRPMPRGSSTPPGPAPELPPFPAPQAAPPPAPLPPPSGPTSRVYPTPRGPAIGIPSGNGVQTYTDPSGGMGIVVPNGNGTSTLIAPNGTVTTVPNPR
jgi:hypothetical protein